MNRAMDHRDWHLWGCRFIPEEQDWKRYVDSFAVPELEGGVPIPAGLGDVFEVAPANVVLPGQWVQRVSVVPPAPPAELARGSAPSYPPPRPPYVPPSDLAHLTYAIPLLEYFAAPASLETVQMSMNRPEEDGRGAPCLTVT